MGKCLSSKAKSEPMSHRYFHSPSVAPLSNYKVLRVISHSSTGEVSHAKHIPSGSECVIKSISFHQESQRSKILSSIAAQKDLDHPNIIKIYETFEEGNFVYIVMEHCSGGELFDWATEHKNLTEATVAEYTKQILSALSYLHCHGLVHRDVKPEKILLQSTAANSPIKLYHFGCAGRISRDKRHHTVVGSLYYIAPEVLKGNYDEKCDIWAAGVITYFLLSGKPPFYDKDQGNVIEQIIHEELMFDGPEWESLTSSARKFLKKMLEKDPIKRPSAVEMLEEKWLSRKSTRKNTIAASAFKHLKDFNVQGMLERASLAYISYELLTPAETEQLTELFQELDTDHNGQLSKKELKEGFKKLGLHFRVNFKHVFEHCAAANDGKIHYNEFIMATADWNKLLYNDRLRKVFNMYDCDGDGVISIQDLTNSLGSTGNKHYFVDLILKADQHGKGTLSFEDFTKYIRAALIKDN